MSAAEFAVGDKVRLTGAGWAYPSQGLGVGAEKSIIRIDPMNPQRVLVDERPGYEWWAVLDSPIDPFGAELVA